MLQLLLLVDGLPDHGPRVPLEAVDPLVDVEHDPDSDDDHDDDGECEEEVGDDGAVRLVVQLRCCC